MVGRFKALGDGSSVVTLSYRATEDDRHAELCSGYLGSYANAVSATSVKAVGYGGTMYSGCPGTITYEHAFLYTNGQMTDLNTFVPAGFRLWVLETATAINDRGAIVGLGTATVRGKPPRVFALYVLDANSYTHSYADTYTHSYADAYTYTHSHSHSHADAYSNSYANTNANSSLAPSPYRSRRRLSAHRYCPQGKAAKCEYWSARNPDRHREESRPFRRITCWVCYVHGWQDRAGRGRASGWQSRAYDVSAHPGSNRIKAAYTPATAFRPGAATTLKQSASLGQESRRSWLAMHRHAAKRLRDQCLSWA